MDVLVFNAGQREQEVRDLKREIADMLRHIQRLNGELEALLRKVRATRRVQIQAFPPEQLLIFIFFPASLGRVPAEGNHRRED